MQLKTKALPGEIRDFEDFIERALNFDWYTDMSDDHRVYQAGRRRREIMDLYAKDNELAGKLWKRLTAETAEGFMVGQSNRGERFVAPNGYLILQKYSANFRIFVEARAERQRAGAFINEI